MVRRDHPMPRAALEAVAGELAYYKGPPDRPKPTPSVRLDARAARHRRPPRATDCPPGRRLISGRIPIDLIGIMK